jgi:hypothetical protein
MNYLQEMMYRRAEAEYERARDEACCVCEPKVVGVHHEYEGGGEYSTCPIYNCEDCDIRECEYWTDYNITEEEEVDESK